MRTLISHCLNKDMYTQGFWDLLSKAKGDFLVDWPHEQNIHAHATKLSLIFHWFKNHKANITSDFVEDPRKV
jgi:hypothetical protein